VASAAVFDEGLEVLAQGLLHKGYEFPGLGNVVVERQRHHAHAAAADPVPVRPALERPPGRIVQGLDGFTHQEPVQHAEEDLLLGVGHVAAKQVVHQSDRG